MKQQRPPSRRVVPLVERGVALLPFVLVGTGTLLVSVPLGLIVLGAFLYYDLAIGGRRSAKP